MPRSLIPSFLRSPAELRRQLAAAEAARALAESRLETLEGKCFRYAQALVHTRTELVAAKEMLAARGIAMPRPRRRIVAATPLGVLQ